MALRSPNSKHHLVAARVLSALSDFIASAGIAGKCQSGSGGGSCSVHDGVVAAHLMYMECSGGILQPTNAAEVLCDLSASLIVGMG